MFRGTNVLNKSLGQHFLKDESLAERIVQAMDIRPGMQVLEIGPGAGALTRLIARVEGVGFRAVEIDGPRVTDLEKEFPGLKGKILRGDILECDPPWEGKFSIIGNFPYNISSQILLRVLEWRDQVDRVVGMFQKEVAQRVVAAPGRKSYGILSVLVQAFFGAEYLFDVPPESFTPPPRVMSGVIRLKGNDNPFGVENMERFTRLVKTSFGQRRKILRNPARGLFDPVVLEEEIFTRRPEQLTIREFADLSKRMQFYE